MNPKFLVIVALAIAAGYYVGVKNPNLLATAKSTVGLS